MEVENGLSFPRYIFNLLHFARAPLFLLFQFSFSFISTSLVGLAAFLWHLQLQYTLTLNITQIFLNFVNMLQRESILSEKYAFIFRL